MKPLVKVALLLSLLPCLAAFSQDFPSKPMRLVVPYPPGSSTDIVGRMVAQKLGTSLASSAGIKVE